MMSVAELFAALAKNGGYVALADDYLDYVGPAALLTDELRREIRRRKTEIVAWLRTPAQDQSAADLIALDYAPDCVFLVGPELEGAAP